MLKLFYTGAFAVNQPNLTPLLTSLGGFVSSSPIPNGRKNSLFSDISKAMSEKGKEEIIGLCIKNDSLTETVSDIQLSILNPETLKGKFKIGFIAIGMDLQMEKLASSADLPYYTELIDFDGLTTIEGNLLPGKYIGVWLQRTIAPFEYLLPIEQQLEQIEISLGWEVVP